MNKKNLMNWSVGVFLVLVTIAGAYANITGTSITTNTGTYTTIVSSVLNATGVSSFHDDLDIYSAGSVNDFTIRNGAGTQVVQMGADGSSGIMRLINSSSSIIHLLDTNSDSYVNADSSLNFGIGTSTPASVLDIQEDTNTNAQIRLRAGGSSNDAHLQFYQTSTYVGQVGWDDSEDNMRFGTASGTKMVIEDNGNVGIATTNPSAVLDVVGTTELNGALTVAADALIKSTGTASNLKIGDDDTDGRLLFQWNNATTTGLINSYGGAYTPLKIEADDLILNSVSGGNVGIGTATTSAVLDVVGTTELNGAVDLVDNDISNIGQMNLNRGDVTISSGAVTVTETYHRVDTESAAASDDLDTVNGGSDGDLLIIRATNTARTVVAKDATGNLALAGDFSLDNSEDRLMLMYDASTGVWVELSRSDNSA